MFAVIFICWNFFFRIAEKIAKIRTRKLEISCHTVGINHKNRTFSIKFICWPFWALLKTLLYTLTKWNPYPFMKTWRLNRVARVGHHREYPPPPPGQPSWSSSTAFAVNFFRHGNTWRKTRCNLACVTSERLDGQAGYRPKRVTSPTWCPSPQCKTLRPLYCPRRDFAQRRNP